MDTQRSIQIWMCKANEYKLVLCSTFVFYVVLSLRKIIYIYVASWFVLNWILNMVSFPIGSNSKISLFSLFHIFSPQFCLLVGYSWQVKGVTVSRPSPWPMQPQLVGPLSTTPRAQTLNSLSQVRRGILASELNEAVAFLWHYKLRY